MLGGFGCAGVERKRFDFAGQASHAGTTPMDQRRDAGLAAAELGLEVERIAREHGGVGTTGSLDLEPGVITAVAGTARLGVDLRHPEADPLAAMLEAVREPPPRSRGGAAARSPRSRSGGSSRFPSTPISSGPPSGRRRPWAAVRTRSRAARSTTRLRWRGSFRRRWFSSPRSGESVMPRRRESAEGDLQGGDRRLRGAGDGGPLGGTRSDDGQGGLNGGRAGVD